MAADKNTLVSALIRIATINGNPTAYLTDILQGRYSRVLGGNGRVIISSSTGGSSATWSIPQGMDDLEIMEIAEMALQRIETGVDDNDGTTPIKQVANGDRLVSYGQFGSIRR